MERLLEVRQLLSSLDADASQADCRRRALMDTLARVIELRNDEDPRACVSRRPRTPLEELGSLQPTADRWARQSLARDVETSVPRYTLSELAKALGEIQVETRPAVQEDDWLATAQADVPSAQFEPPEADTIEEGWGEGWGEAGEVARTARTGAMAWHPFASALIARRLEKTMLRQRLLALHTERRWWYKPVAIISGRCYSITEGCALEFVLGKRMPCEQLQRGQAKSGFLVYDCAARALQETICRRKDQFAHAHLGVLRVRASRECPPSGAEWPSASGRWAFKVIVPSSVALQRQLWMQNEEKCRSWLPSSKPGLCRQCALGDRSCVHAHVAARKQGIVNKNSERRTLSARVSVSDNEASRTSSRVGPRRPTALDYRYYA